MSEAMKWTILTGPLIAWLTTGAVAQTTWYVDDDNCPGPGSGSEADPFCSIQDGIDAAVDGDEVLVAPGVYHEFEIRFWGKAITVQSQAGPLSTIIAHPPIDDGHTVVRFQGESPDAVLDGFTIRDGGSGEYPDGNPVYEGGGIWVGGSPTVRDCIITRNGVGGFESCGEGRGGGVYVAGGAPTFVDCMFSDNGAGGYMCYGLGGGVAVESGTPVFIDCSFVGNGAGLGGGLSCRNSSPLLLYCSFTDNTAANLTGQSGAGMAVIQNTTPLVIGCVFEGNHGEDGGDDHGRGGAMLVGSAVPTVVSTLFVGNVAGEGGAAFVESDDALVRFVNCTFSGNVALASGGVIAGPDWVPSLASIENSILWDNGPDQIQGAADVIYSDVMGGWPGEGNIDAVPLFVDPADGDYRLQPGSPCIDAGSAALLPPDTADLDGDGDTDEPLPFDLDGNPRVVGANVDMGAYEFQGLHCPADVDGDGTVNVTDLTAVILGWGTPDADINGDGTTDVQDLVAVINAWGPCG